MTKIKKSVKEGYNILNQSVDHAEVKAKKTDNGGTFYIYDLFDSSNVCMALNRYVFINNNAERPFAKLSKAEEDILNPIIEEPIGEIL